MQYQDKDSLLVSIDTTHQCGTEPQPRLEHNWSVTSTSMVPTRLNATPVLPRPLLQFTFGIFFYFFFVLVA